MPHPRETPRERNRRLDEVRAKLTPTFSEEDEPVAAVVNRPEESKSRRQRLAERKSARRSIKRARRKGLIGPGRITVKDDEVVVEEPS